MRILHRCALAVGFGGSLAAAAFLGIGCGSGDDNSAKSAADSGGADTTTDVVSHDGNADVTTDAHSDSPGLMDAKPQDSTATDVAIGDAADAGADAHADADAGGDAAADAGGDAAADADAGSQTAALLGFANQVAQAVCTQLAACCFGTDAAAFDTASCLHDLLPGGYANVLRGVTDLADAGVLTLNSAKAQACLSDIAAIDCSANLLSAQAHLSTVHDCTAAVTGLVGAGAPCAATIACSGNQYCTVPTDGGAGLGLCTPLSGDGGSCDYGSQTQSEQVCSIRGTGSDGLRCVNQDLSPPYEIFDASAWACGPTLDAGATCALSADCTSQMCDDTNFVCLTSRPFAFPSTCTTYTIKDAGQD
jgi:hypothetical protein